MLCKHWHLTVECCIRKCLLYTLSFIYSGIKKTNTIAYTFINSKLCRNVLVTTFNSLTTAKQSILSPVLWGHLLFETTHVTSKLPCVTLTYVIHIDLCTRIPRYVFKWMCFVNMFACTSFHHQQSGHLHIYTSTHNVIILTHQYHHTLGNIPVIISYSDSAQQILRVIKELTIEQENAVLLRTKAYKI